VALLRAVAVPRRPVAALEPVIGGERYARLTAEAARFLDGMTGRTVWNVNSTAVGGGVAEMLQALVGYVSDLDVPVRWMVIGGDPDFYAITKRLHNQLHGAGGPAELGDVEAEHYRRVLAANAGELLELVRPGDIVLLHDPQTAGLTVPLARAGMFVVWRCHVGVEWHNDATRAAWKFLRPYLASAHGFGLTVAEGMWKARAVIGSAVGGIVDQIVDGTGVLVRDAADLRTFGSEVRRLLDQPDRAERMGLAARARIRDHYLGDLHLLHYARLFDALINSDVT